LCPRSCSTAAIVSRANCGRYVIDRGGTTPPFSASCSRPLLISGLQSTALYSFTALRQAMDDGSTARFVLGFMGDPWIDILAMRIASRSASPLSHLDWVESRTWRQASEGIKRLKYTAKRRCCLTASGTYVRPCGRPRSIRVPPTSEEQHDVMATMLQNTSRSMLWMTLQLFPNHAHGLGLQRLRARGVSARIVEYRPGAVIGLHRI
jgi:hypothetical protein